MFCAAAGVSVSVFPAAAQTLTYKSPEVGCDWLAIEYDVIKSYAVEGPLPPPTAQEYRQGAMMTFAMFLTIPLALFSEAFDAVSGREKQQYDFSRDPDDIVAAAKVKTCDRLLQTIAEDRRKGVYPSSVSLNLQ